MKSSRVKSTEEALQTSDINLIFRMKGGVVKKIWPQVVLGMLYAVAIRCLDIFVPALVNFPMTLVSVMGMVIGLLLVFRTNTAYQSFMEGRRVWSTMAQQIRVLTYNTWLGVKEETPKDLIEKVTAINLYVAFAYATKNHLRGEYDKGISDLISHIPKFFAKPKGANNRNKKQNSNLIEKDMTKLNISNDENPNNLSLGDEVKTLFNFSTKQTKKYSIVDGISFSGRLHTCKAYDKLTSTNIPLEIIYSITSYCNDIINKKAVDGPIASQMIDAVNKLMDSLTQFERIRKTPIPLAYSVHLHQSVWLYLLSLPFQLVGELKWMTVPAMGVACFAFIGILAIGWEIENPFGYDDNDLPLEDFCKVIENEAQMVTRNKYPACENWIFSSENLPLIPASLQTATELAKLTEKEVRAFLLNRDTSVVPIPKRYK